MIFAMQDAATIRVFPQLIVVQQSAPGSAFDSLTSFNPQCLGSLNMDLSLTSATPVL